MKNRPHWWTQKSLDRIVHLSNLYSAIETKLAYDGVLCSAFTQLATSPLRAAIYWSHHAIVTCMHHLITCLMQLLLQTSLHLVRRYLASLLTILGTLHKPSRDVSKITTDRLRRFPEVSSITRHSFGIGHLSVYTLVT